MSETTPIRQPALIVVTGRPGAGKTMLAHALAQAVRCPAICRDEIKEGFLNTGGEMGPGDDDVAWHVYEAFFATVELLLRHRVTVVAEAAFQHQRWAAKLEALREIARVRIVVCAVDAEMARARRIERGAADPERGRFHLDPATPMGSYEPPHLDVPTLTVDTSDGYRPGFEEIVAFARG